MTKSISQLHPSVNLEQNHIGKASGDPKKINKSPMHITYSTSITDRGGRTAHTAAPQDFEGHMAFAVAALIEAP